MPLNNKETKRWRECVQVTHQKCARCGVNKKQEITRLLYEISKKEEVKPDTILDNQETLLFKDIKPYLLHRRFPQAHKNKELKNCFLPKLEFKANYVHHARSAEINPRQIFVETAVKKSGLTQRFKSAYPAAQVTEIPALKEYLKNHRCPTLADYDRRCDNIFIVDERFDFFKRCPCTSAAVPCGYHIFNLGFGCIYECSYCFLQGYTNSPGLIFPAKLDPFFDRFAGFAGRAKASSWQQGSRLRLGTGEFCDSLMLDNITQYSTTLIEYFSEQPDVLFELKTKSANIDNLLRAKHRGNVVIGWSLNPQIIIEDNELYSTSLKERLAAAKKCVEAGYLVAFHFDPIIYFEDWVKEYEQVLQSIFEAINAASIAWISLGTLRFNPTLKPIIENRFPGNTILDGELLKGYDAKLRYPYSLRFQIYEKMLGMLKKHHHKLPAYLCMEDKKMWQNLGLEMPFK